MLRDCIGKLGKQINSVDREDLERSFDSHLKSGKSEYEASVLALADFHKGLFDATNELRTAVGLEPVQYTQIPHPTEPLKPELPVAEQRRLEWQDKLTARIQELEGNPQAKRIVNGRRPDLMTTGQLKDMYNNLAVLKAGDVSVPEPEAAPVPEKVPEGERLRQAKTKTKETPQSLSQFVRKMGGIRSSKYDRGEVQRISNKETGSTGLINKNSQHNAESMAGLAWDFGYLRDVFPTREDINGNDFMNYVEADVTGQHKHFAAGDYEELDRQIQKKYESQYDEDLAKQAKMLQDSGVRSLLADIEGQGHATPEQHQQLERAFEQHGLDTSGVRAFIETLTDGSGTVREVQPAPARTSVSDKPQRIFGDAAEPEGQVDTSFNPTELEAKPKWQLEDPEDPRAADKVEALPNGSYHSVSIMKDPDDPNLLHLQYDKATAAEINQFRNGDTAKRLLSPNLSDADIYQAVLERFGGWPTKKGTFSNRNEWDQLVKSFPAEAQALLKDAPAALIGEKSSAEQPVRKLEDLSPSEKSAIRRDLAPTEHQGKGKLPSDVARTYGLSQADLARLEPLGEVGKFGQTSHVIKAALSSTENDEIYNSFARIFAPQELRDIDPEFPEILDRGGQAANIVDAIAQDMEYPRSSHMDADAWGRFLDKYGLKLSDEAIATVLSALEHQERWHRNLLAFVHDPELDEPNRMIFERGQKFGWEQFANPKWGTVTPEDYDPNNPAFDLKGDKIIKKEVLRIGRKYGIQESRGEGGLSDTVIKAAYLRAVQRTAQEQLAKGAGDGTLRPQDQKDTPPGKAEAGLGQKEELSDKKILFSKIAPAPPTDTPEFKNWFRNSKVVDENGEPLVVYHGTPTGGFTEFDADQSGRAGDPGIRGKGFYFSNNEGLADMYQTRPPRGSTGGGPQTYSVYLSIRNPYDGNKDVLGLLGRGNDTSETRRTLESSGYDGVIYTLPDGKNVEYVAFHPTQIKSVNNRGTFDPNNPNILFTRPQFMTAWHGSPHRFDKFDSSKIGTGEGAQAYGHGLYFADKESVAEFYKRKLSNNPIQYKGNNVPFNYTTPSIDTLWSDVKNGFIKPNIGNVEDAIVGSVSSEAHRFAAERNGQINNKDLADALDVVQKRFKYMGAVGNAQLTTLIELGKEVAPTLKATDFSVDSGTKYKVDLKPEADEYLLWDKPLSEQSEKVKKALQNLYGKSPYKIEQFSNGNIAVMEWNPDLHYWEEMYAFPNKDAAQKFIDEQSTNPTGQEVYKSLSRQVGGSDIGTKAASEYLHSLGIRGIKYLDGPSRGQGEGSYNYVLFDQNDVQILDVHFNQQFRTEERQAVGHIQSLTRHSEGVLARRAKWNIDDNGLLKTNEFGIALLTKGMRQWGDPGIFFGFQTNVGTARDLKDLVGKMDAQGTLEKRALNRAVAAINKATQGDLAVSVESSKYPLLSKYSAQEELAHRADARTRQNVDQELAPYKSLDSYNKAVQTVAKTYTTASERELHNEVIAKLFRDDAEGALGIGEDGVSEIRTVYRRELLRSGATSSTVKQEFEQISPKGRAFAQEYEQSTNRSRRNDAEPFPGRSAEVSPFPRSSGEVRRESGSGGRPTLERPRPDLTRLRQASVPPSSESTALTRAESRYIEVKAKDNPELAKDLIREVQFAKAKQMTIGDYAIDVLNMPKAIKASVDLSAAGRQGWIASLAHPLIAAKAFKKQLKVAASAKEHEKFVRDLNLHPFIELAEESKLFLAHLAGESINEREEQFMTRILGENRFFKNNKFEAARKLATFPVRASERAYTTFLDDLRINSFAALAVKLHQANVRTGRSDSMEQYRGLAAFINYTTGRGDLGPFNEAAKYLNGAFFSARYWASRLEVLNPVFYAKLPPGARSLVLKDLIASIAAMAAIGLLLKLAGAKVEWDNPTDPNVLKIGFGDYTYDISAGELKHLRYLARMAMATQEKAPTDKMTYLTERYFRSSLAPVPSAVWSATSGKNYVGEPTSWQKEGMDLLVPIMIDNYKDAIQADGIPGLIKMTPEFFGISTTRFRSMNEMNLKREQEPTPEGKRAWTSLMEKRAKSRP